MVPTMTGQVEDGKRGWATKQPMLVQTWDCKTESS